LLQQAASLLPPGLPNNFGSHWIFPILHTEPGDAPKLPFLLGDPGLHTHVLHGSLESTPETASLFGCVSTAHICDPQTQGRAVHAGRANKSNSAAILQDMIMYFHILPSGLSFSHPAFSVNPYRVTPTTLHLYQQATSCCVMWPTNVRLGVPFL